MSSTKQISYRLISMFEFMLHYSHLMPVMLLLNRISRKSRLISANIATISERRSYYTQARRLGPGQIKNAQAALILNF